MAFFDWFSKKPASDATTQTHSPSSGLMQDEATLPMQPGGRATVGLAQQSHAVNRKTERLERRELLYGVVREAMTHVGVLSASYKFKVLSLDSHGSQFLVMMDIDSHYVEGVRRLAEMESLIAKNAKARHEIQVTSVYWRVIEQVTAGLSTHASPVPSVPVPPTVAQEAPAPPPAPVVPAVVPSHPRFDPLAVDEFAAFKQARAAAAKNQPAGTELPQPAKRDPVPPQDFQNTQLDDSNSPLSGTQYGELK